MKTDLTSRRFVALGIVTGIWLTPGTDGSGQQADETIAPRELSVVTRAAGTFDVKLTPLASDDANGTSLGRMSIEKQYHGDLAGTARGEMLTGLTTVKDSAVYVAVERVSGTLHGRSGGFLLHHRGIMTRGAQDLAIAVVPDSGTGELSGLAGRMEIVIEGGRHSYIFEYTLP